MQGPGLACLGLPQVVLKNMSLVRATVSIKRISAEPEDEAVFVFSPKHVVGRQGGVHPSVVSATAVVPLWQTQQHRTQRASEAQEPSSQWMDGMVWW